jgi:hypothetical protein
VPCNAFAVGNVPPKRANIFAFFTHDITLNRSHRGVIPASSIILSVEWCGFRTTEQTK